MHAFEGTGEHCVHLVGGETTCKEPRNSTVHVPYVSGDDAPTEVFRPVMDAPAEDGMLEGMPEPGLEEETDLAVLLARKWHGMVQDLRGGLAVIDGPWPVRQYLVENGYGVGWKRMWSTINSLRAVGDPFTVVTWWQQDQYLVRITWADWYTYGIDEISTAVTAGFGSDG